MDAGVFGADKAKPAGGGAPKAPVNQQAKVHLISI
jgi:hypothetical protein